MPVTITKDASTDFPSGYNRRRFHRELHESSLQAAFLSSSQNVNTIVFRFTHDLDAAETAAFEALVTAHDPLSPDVHGSLLADLPVASAGVTAFARDVRKPGEGPGSGTGALVYSDGTQWLLSRSDEAPTV